MSADTYKKLRIKAQLVAQMQRPQMRRKSKTQRKPVNDDDYGQEILFPIGIVTMHHGDKNDTCETLPHISVVRERLRAAANNPDLPGADRQAAREVLRLSYNERV
jgi:hypothetical protein